MAENTSLTILKVRLADAETVLARLQDAPQSENKQAKISLTENDIADLKKRIAKAEKDEQPERDKIDGQAQEFDGLVKASNVGEIFGAAISHKQTTGATRELQDETGCGGNQVPLQMLWQVKAVSTPPTNVQANQQPTEAAVYAPDTLPGFFHIPMPVVPNGEAVFNTLAESARAGASAPGEGGTVSETTGSFDSETLLGARIQKAFKFSREGAAKFSDMRAALTDDLDKSLMDRLIRQILTGTNGLFTDGVLADHNVSGESGYADYKARIAYGRVDGRMITSTKGARALFGQATHAHAATKYRSENAGNTDALQDVIQALDGVMVCEHVPAVASSKQEALVRLGMRRDAVCPIWQGVTLITDEVTGAADGQITITAVMLYNFKVLRPAGFWKGEFQLAA